MADDPRIRRGYVSMPFGDVHYRTAGSGPPLVLLHDSFRSSTMHLPLIAALADAFEVIALDTPGYGASDPLALGRRPEIDDFGDALAQTLAALGLSSPNVYSGHTSAKIALSCGYRHPGAIGFLVCDGLSAPVEPTPEDYVARYMQPFEVTADGAYVAKAWTQIRDFKRFFPWFDPVAAHRMPVDQKSLAADHVYALGLYGAGPSWVAAYGAALRYRPMEAIRGSRTPTAYIARTDDVLFKSLAAVQAAAPPGAVVETVPADDGRWIGRLRELFGAHGGSSGGARPAAPPRPGGRRSVAALPHGDVELRLYGPDAPPTTVVLHDAPGSGATAEATVRALGEARAILVPDLPGCDQSDPLPSPGAEAYVAVLIRLLDDLGAQPVEVIAHGMSTPLALLLAARAPGRVSRLVLDAALLADREARQAMAGRYCPPIALSRQGGHMVEAWQRGRDIELQWPWYDETRAGIRWIDADVDARRLHQRLLGTVRQPDHYGDACMAALEVDAPALLDAAAVPTAVITRGCDPRYPVERPTAAPVAWVEAAAAKGSPAAAIAKALAALC